MRSLPPVVFPSGLTSSRQLHYCVGIDVVTYAASTMMTYTSLAQATGNRSGCGKIPAGSF